ncbi:GDP-mannose 4,6-dehydratase [Kitasatospora sp. NPDC058162]|uniref:GDP-mannose 4,6-dehydratase n=1 Tax=Kitasatospora sp. NPDC058162 TaxID=3346362 RepID=UPI0036DECA7C
MAEGPGRDSDLPGVRGLGLSWGQADQRKDRISRLIPELRFVDGDLMDRSSPVSAVDAIQPEEVYHPGAISFVPMSWRQPELVTEVNDTGVLEAIRIVSGINRPSGDYAIGTGRMHSVRDAARIAFECLGPDGEEYLAVDWALVSRAA